MKVRLFITSIFKYDLDILPVWSINRSRVCEWLGKEQLNSEDLVRMTLIYSKTTIMTE